MSIQDSFNTISNTIQSMGVIGMNLAGMRDSPSNEYRAALFNQLFPNITYTLEGLQAVLPSLQAYAVVQTEHAKLKETSKGMASQILQLTKIINDTNALLATTLPSLSFPIANEEAFRQAIRNVYKDELANKDDQIARQTHEIGLKDEVLRQKVLDISKEHSLEIAETLQQVKARVLQLEVEVASKDTVIKERTERMSQLEVEIASKDADIKHTTERVSQLEAEVVSKDAELDETRKACQKITEIDDTDGTDEATIEKRISDACEKLTSTLEEAHRELALHQEGLYKTRVQEIQSKFDKALAENQQLKAENLSCKERLTPIPVADATVSTTTPTIDTTMGDQTDYPIIHEAPSEVIESLTKQVETLKAELIEKQNELDLVRPKRSLRPRTKAGRAAAASPYGSVDGT